MRVEEYIQGLFIKEDSTLDNVLQSIKDQGMPMMSVSPESGKLLSLLVKLSGAKQVLEVGCLGGYSGICLSRGFGEDGQLTSLELQQEYADLAHQNLKKAGVGDKVTYYIGEALDSFRKIEEEGKKFDFFFIDADKENYSNYLEYAIRLAHPGAVIIGDNVLWHGRTLDPTDQDSSTVAIRHFNELAANHPKLDSVLIPIGDGFTLGIVKE